VVLEVLREGAVILSIEIMTFVITVIVLAMWIVMVLITVMVMMVVVVMEKSFPWKVKVTKRRLCFSS